METNTLPLNAIEDGAFKAYQGYYKKQPNEPQLNLEFYEEKDEGYRIITMRATGFSFMCQGCKVSGNFRAPIHCSTIVVDPVDDEQGADWSIAEAALMHDIIRAHCGPMNYAGTGVEE
jgi:hypothetical protein